MRNLYIGFLFGALICGIVLGLINRYHRDAERARADSLQAELAECRAGNPCTPDLQTGIDGQITAISLWVNGEYRTFYSTIAYETTGFSGRNLRNELAECVDLWKILKAEYDDCEREFAIHRRDCPCPPETLDAYFEVPSPDTTGGPR